MLVGRQEPVVLVAIGLFCGLSGPAERIIFTQTPPLFMCTVAFAAVGWLRTETGRAAVRRSEDRLNASAQGPISGARS